jgi:F0F1-type ATP synthase membrane subunit b/b'
MAKARKKINRESDLYVDELISAAEAAVIGYEKYLMDRIDYKDLARIMTILRELLPFEGYDRNEHGTGTH